jgi:Fe-S cluster biogenesis protein NfuA
VPDVSEPDRNDPKDRDREAGGPAAAGTAVEIGAPSNVEVSDEVRTQREADLRALIELMRPAVQADGGDLELVSVDVGSGVVEVQLQGACSSCAISSATLQGGVDRILRGRLDWVTEVLGGVDETADPFDSAALGRGAYVPKA